MREVSNPFEHGVLGANAPIACEQSSFWVRPLHSGDNLEGSWPPLPPCPPRLLCSKVEPAPQSTPDVSAGESPQGTQRFSHRKGSRRSRRICLRRASIRCSSPASRSRPRPTGGTAGPSGALSSHRGPSPLRKGHTRLKRGPAPAPGRVRRISVSRSDRTWVEARLHAQVISPAGVFVSPGRHVSCLATPGPDQMQT